MSRETVAPEMTEESGSIGGKRFTHPAFATINANRISGKTVLFGSDFKHDRFVRISIGAAELVRSLSHDWPFGHLRKHIEVDLSEAQWAQFVSSMNIGEGTQCTMVYKDGEAIPGLPDPVDQQAQFRGELTGHMKDAIARIDDAIASVDAMGLSKVKAKELKDKLQIARMQIGVNQEFVAKVFGEHMERTVQKAKVEVNAYINSAVRQIGLNNLHSSSVEPLTLDMPKTEG